MIDTPTDYDDTPRSWFARVMMLGKACNGYEVVEPFKVELFDMVFCMDVGHGLGPFYCVT